jgi:hypothetical protein
MPTLTCPTCGRQVEYQIRQEVPFRPFCSQRCQQVDLGRWLNEEYRVPEEIPPDLIGQEERELRNGESDETDV